MRKTIADVIQKFRENKSVRYTETQRAEVIAALDQLLNNAKKNVSLDTSLRDSFAKKYTSGVCVSASPYEYGALTNQKSHEEWSSLANHLLRTSTANVMDEEIKMTEYEKKSGLTVHEDVDQMSVQDILSMFRMLPSLGDRGVVLKDFYALMMIGAALEYNETNPYIAGAAKSFARRANLYEVLKLDPSSTVKIFDEAADDEMKQFGMGSFRTALLRIGQHQVLEGALGELQRRVFLLTWVSNVVRDSASVAIPSIRLEERERQEFLSSTNVNIHDMQASLPSHFQDCPYASIIHGAGIVKHVFQEG